MNLRAQSLCLWLALVALWFDGSRCRAQESADATRRQLEAKFAEALRAAGPFEQRLEGITAAELEQQANARKLHRQLQRERLEGKWVAALILEESQIAARFETWKGLADFLNEHEALVEVWTSAKRRLSAQELAELQRAAREQPTFVTASVHDPESGAVKTYRIEWGLRAAEHKAEAEAGYARHREMQVAVRKALGARDERERITPQSQWSALAAAVSNRVITVTDFPARPVGGSNLFLAVEYQVDVHGNATNIAGVYRESDIQRIIVRDSEGRSAEKLRVWNRRGVREASGYRVRPGTDTLEPALSPVLGEESVELRVTGLEGGDPRGWNLLEFGEPELVRQSALAQFSLINAHLERQRKALAVRKANLDLIAEPIIAAMNVGGGLAGAGFPYGEAARLAYNLITPKYIADVPSVKEMRELFALLAAKRRDAQLDKKLAHFLSKEDVAALEKAAQGLSEAEIDEYARSVSDSDLEAMVFLARMRRIDQRVTNLLNILTSAANVSGETESGLMRNIFNNSYVSLNGDWSIKNSLAAVLGEELLTPRNSVPLKDLVEGRGPAKAWAQYFDFSVDLRAVVNTIGRIPRSGFAEKELYKPLPYALHMGDLAAYEVRIFGFPLFIFYKRGLIKADRKAFEEDYAYGIDGAKILEHFRTKAEMDREIRAGRMLPMGYVKVPDGKGGWKDTNLAVFAHRIPSGRHKGKMVIVIYGLKAYAEHSQVIERELKRLRQFEQALEQGGVIEQVVERSSGEMSGEAAEPRLRVGREATAEFGETLGRLLEEQRARKRAAWGMGSDGAPQTDAQLLSVDRFFSSFVYRNEGGDVTQMTLIPALEDAERSARKAEEARAIERARREGLTNRGVVFLNSAVERDGGFDIGPLLEDAKGHVLGAGVRTTAAEVEEVFAAMERLPVEERAFLEEKNYAGALVDLELGGKKQAVFLTIEFPPSATLTRERTNAATGEWERLIYEDGLLTTVTTPRGRTEIAYGATGVETASRTYAGRNELVEESRTLKAWRRGAKADAYAPRVSKARMNFVTGQLRQETYGAFAEPIVVADEQFVTTNRFSTSGLLEGAAVFENGTEEGQGSARVMSPLPGRQRFELTARGREAGRVEWKRVDLIKRLEKRIVLDAFGRKRGERWSEQVNGRPLESRSEFFYRDDFLSGQIPAATRVIGSSGALRSEAVTASYDPSRRTLVAVESDYTGRVLTNVWDYRWEAPAQTHSALRVTTNWYDRAETSSRGAVLGRTSGQEIVRFAGEYDAAQQQWTLWRTNLYRPEIASGEERVTASGFGTVLATGSAETITSFAYDGDGRLTNVTERSRDVTVRTEDDFRWSQGARDARAQVFADNRLVDVFRFVTDAEGRRMVDGIREHPGLEVRTVIHYEGESDRVAHSEELQNGQRRTVRTRRGEAVTANGDWYLMVEVKPTMGLVSTQTFRLGEAPARAVSTVYEDGTVVGPREWFPGTGVARISEVRGTSGRLRGRVEVLPNFGTNRALPYDLVRRYEAGWLGGEGLAEEQGIVRGTDILIFSDTANERVYYDFGKTYASPIAAVDSHRRNGIRASVGGALESNVVQLIRQSESEAGIVTELTDVRGLFFRTVKRRVSDRAGKVIEEVAGRVASGGLGSNDVGQTEGRISYAYKYEPGWLVERAGGLVFTTNAPVQGMAVNGSGREFLTGVEVSSTNGVVRRVHSPRVLASNPHMPGRSNVWTEWTASELGRDGSELFQSHLIYDGQGRLAVARTVKTTARGKPAVKTVYDVGGPSSGELKPVPIREGSRRIELALSGGSPGRSDSEFLYWYAISKEAILWSIADRRGRRVTVIGDGDSATREAAKTVARWPTRSGHTLWLPDAAVPTEACVVRAPAHYAESGGIVVVSMRDLEEAGLDAESIQSIEGEVMGGEGTVEVSPVFALQGTGRRERPADSRRYVHEVITHSSGLTTLVTAEEERTEGEIHGAQRLSAVTTFNDLPVLSTYTVRGKAQVFIVDHTAEAARPMYAIWPREGRFLEHYKTVRRDGAEVYAVVQGFELPRVEVFDPRLLADEVFASTVAYGRDYQVIYHPARGRGWLGGALAALESRVVANAFKFGGQEVFDRLGWEALGSGFETYFDYGALHRAENQAREIGRLPTVAEALLASRTVPWEAAGEARGGGNGAAASEPATPDWSGIGFALNRLRLQQRTGLIPTARETAVERYVDTEKEADLIVLAAKVGERVLARELLEFYWSKSQGGQAPLHTSYDAQAGTAMTTDLSYKRPVHAARTAAAQLAIADAAFTAGLESGDAQWMTFGRNLIELVLIRFRAPEDVRGEPRGITEHEYLPLRRAYGFTLWPPAELYSLGSNVRMALLLKRLSGLSDRFADRTWRFRVQEALEEQQGWLRKTVFAEMERTGVPAKGWFAVQDIYSETTAVAPEKWTSAGDWLALIEAAHELGMAREQTHRWLENLARVHGVWVKGVWGLDWSVATLRPDAISTELTAGFARVAKAVGHSAASEFAARQVASLAQEGLFPALVTAAAPQRAIQSGQGFAVHPRAGGGSWGFTYGPYKDVRLNGGPVWNTSNAPAQITTIPVAQVWPRQRTDLTVFVLITAGVYAAILGSAIFWWSFRALRRRDSGQVFPDPLVSGKVMELAEERWARRVLGARTPANAEHTRFSNAPVEANFLMQLRAIYKLVVEWRRQEKGWAEDDRRIVEDESDDWLNGLDEYACVLGLYMRWVIKAGAKDGFDQGDVLKENEDSNHIWSRLVMFCSEYYWGILTLLKNYNNAVLQGDKADLYGQMSQLLSSLGVRQREEAFDAGTLFDYPANRGAMDLLVVQQPGRSLDDVFVEASKRLRIPYLHLVRIVERYKEFKRREKPYPIHPYIIEFAKIVPHFMLMGLGALVWYNQRLGDSPIVPYLWSQFTQLALSPVSLIWAGPLLASMVLGVVTHFVRVYRFDAPMLAREKTELFLDATLTSLFVKRHSVMPKAKQGRWWNPDPYEWAGWGLRAAGYLGLGITLLSLETPSFATFLVVKGILAMLAFVEVAAIVVPLAATAFSKFLQDWITRHGSSGRLIHFVNRLNITATRPASPLWLSLKYHTQPSVPTGDFWSMAQAVALYFVLGAVFFFAGGYLCQQILSLWFMDTYLTASNWKLFFGGLLFWNTMYLLRYGLFLFFTGVASALVTFPIRTVFGILAGVHVVLVLFGGQLGVDVSAYPGLTYSLMFLGLLLMMFEGALGAGIAKLNLFRSRPAKRKEREQRALAEIRDSGTATLGVVYMSGDDLSHQKLTPELLMERWTILRDRLGSEVVEMLFGALGRPDDATLRRWFELLYSAEKRSDVTLWHPLQISVGGRSASISEETIRSLVPTLPEGVTIAVETAEEREQVLRAWHVRRWLVSMMSTAGHSQDTAINLVDIALRLEAEGLAGNTVFYLVQNKYDNSDTNRPSQSAYDRGELGHRNKLARLLAAVAPGARAYSLQNWTPFGFKAGGLTGMDLVHEESLKLTTMLLLDRNATVHDLDGLMTDLTTALTDPDVVIVIPGRGTTNTLTSVGQGSQMVEEGHRSFLKGLIGVLGGRASEAVGTGWGNILAVYYGRVQRALMDAHSPKMPLSSRMRRGSSFAVRAEGLIGFAPHAVGISEDTWAVSQTAHNAIALGRKVKFLVSKAMWHKIRETWSHAEWLASFPRWSGGYLQMMHDPIMQRVNDFGASSVFAKEVRANSGRNFLSAPFALFNILFMPLAIMLDITPFIQILVVLWNFGFVMNQILTVHGLNTYLESSGFYRVGALIGAGMAGAACWLKPALQPFAPALLVLGFLTGGFFVGISRWLYTRVRDMLLFGPQLVLHALGQVVRQTLEFTVSGASPQDARGVNMAFRAWAGPREDRPWEGYPQFINLKTVIWVVGLLSVVLNLFALANLDMLNVLLLLPSLLFSASALLGPFVLRPRAGAPLGKFAFVPRLLGWATALVFYVAVSMLVARERWLKLCGVLVFAAVFALLLRNALRFFGYRRRWNSRRENLSGLLRAALTEEVDSRAVAEALMQRAMDGQHVTATLDRLKIAGEHRARIEQFLAEQVAPMLRSATGGAKRRRLSERFVSDYSRSLALGLFVLVWFFVVPVPGVLVFTAGSYRFSMNLGAVVQMVGWTIVAIVAAALLGRLLQWLDRGGLAGKSLRDRFARICERLFGAGGGLSQYPAAQASHACALLTDAQTYFDQRSLAYARQTLAQVERLLR